MSDETAGYPSLDEQMAEAIGNMRRLSGEIMVVDRKGWTRTEWVAEAEEIMEHIDGSVRGLLNGHVLAVLEELRELRRRNASLTVLSELHATEHPALDQERVYLTLACTEISIMPEHMRDRRVFTIKVERTSPGKFAIRWQGMCLSRDREWVYEHVPSERIVAWLAEHRFDYDEALTIARELAPTLKANGRTVQEWMAFAREQSGV